MEISNVVQAQPNTYAFFDDDDGKAIAKVVQFFANVKHPNGDESYMTAFVTHGEDCEPVCNFGLITGSEFRKILSFNSVIDHKQCDWLDKHGWELDG